MLRKIRLFSAKYKNLDAVEYTFGNKNTLVNEGIGNHVLFSGQFLVSAVNYV